MNFNSISYVTFWHLLDYFKLSWLFNTFKITFWEFCNAFTCSQNYSLWQFHLNFEMEKEKMSRFGQGGFSYMRRPLDPGLFSFGCILSKEMSLFQSLLITMGFGEIKDSHMSLKFTADLFMLKVFVENTSTKASVYFCFDIYLTFVGALLSNRGNLEIAWMLNCKACTLSKPIIIPQPFW